MKELMGQILMIIGVFFILVAGFGVLRMPDIFLRLSASTKATTLGLGLILLGTAVYFSDDLGVSTRAIATIIFVFLTSPISAHVIGRAAYSDGCQLSEKTHLDELKGRYYHDEHHLAGPPKAPDSSNQ